MFVHGSRRIAPATASRSARAHDKTARLRPQLDFCSKLCLFEQRFRHPDAAGVADPHDTSSNSHCDYIAATFCRPRKLAGWHANVRHVRRLKAVSTMPWLASGFTFR